MASQTTPDVHDHTECNVELGSQHEALDQHEVLDQHEHLKNYDEEEENIPQNQNVSDHAGIDVEIDTSSLNENHDNLSPEGHSTQDDSLGISNLGFHASLPALPVLDDIDEQLKNRYSVVIDTSDEDQGSSRYGPTLDRATCTCNCHDNNNRSVLNFDNILMSALTRNGGLCDDVNCTGESCNAMVADLQVNVQGYDNEIFSLDGSPDNTLGHADTGLASVVRIINSQSSSSPTTDKEPPLYKSLIFSILQDEPPKYEEVTGKKLADELIPTSSTAGGRNIPGRRPTLRQRLICIGTFVVVVTVTVLLLYLSAAVLDSELFTGRDRGNNNKGIDSPGLDLTHKKHNMTVVQLTNR